MTRSKKGKQQQKQQKKNKSRRSGGSPGSSMSGSAPAAISSVIKQSVRFSGGMNGESLVMNVCAPICQVGGGSLGTTGAIPAMIPSSGTPRQSGQLALTTFEVQTAGTAAGDGFTSPVWDLIASAFVRFRVRKLSFHYAPQTATTKSNRLVFAFAEDPVHPLIWSSTVTQDTLLALADSMPFAPWLPWKMDVTNRMRDSGLLYTYDPTLVNPGNVSGPMERFSSFGSIGILAETTDVDTDVSYGVLYMCTEVELVEFCPVSVTRPSLNAQLKTVASKLREQKVPIRREGASASLPAEEEPSDCVPIGVPQFDRKTKESSPFPITSQGVVTSLRNLASNRWKAQSALSRLEGEMEDELRCVEEELGTDAERPENRMIISRLKRTLEVLRAANSLSSELTGEDTLVSKEC